MRFIRRFLPRPKHRPFIDLWVASTIHAYDPKFPITDRLVLTAALPGVAAFWMALGQLFPEKFVPLLKQAGFNDAFIDRLLDTADLDEACVGPDEMVPLQVITADWLVGQLSRIATERPDLGNLPVDAPDALVEAVLKQGLGVADLSLVFKVVAVNGLRVGYAKPSIARQLIWDYVKLQEREARFVLEPALRDVFPEKLMTSMAERARTLQDHERRAADMLSEYEDTFGPVEAALHDD